MSDRLPSLPLFVDDYEGATTHLTLEEDGAYLRLLRLCWRTPKCSVPDDRDWIMRRMRVSLDDYERLIEPIITEFFKRSRGRVYQKRLLQEYEYAIARQNRRKEAGKKGGEAKAQKENGKTSSKAKRLPEQPDDNAVAPSPAQPSLIEEEAKASPSPANGKSTRAIRIPADWRPNPLPANVEELTAQWPSGRLDREREAFVDYWLHRQKDFARSDWDAAWRNRIRDIHDRVIRDSRNGRAQQHQPARESTFETGLRLANELELPRPARSG